MPSKSASLPPRFFERQREPEIQDARPQVRAHDDVVRLEVAMHQSARVGYGQSARDFPKQPGLLLETELGGEAVNGKPLDEFHDNGRRVRLHRARRTR